MRGDDISAQCTLCVRQNVARCHIVTGGDGGEYRAFRLTKRYERFAGIAGSIRFNARELHHFGRLFGFVGEELTEVGR